MTSKLDSHQYTLRDKASCCGVGLHSGRNVNLTIKPAPVDSGIRFLRTDLAEAEPLKAHMDKVVDTRLATTLGNGDFRVSTTEHLLAALKAFGVDNADIELDADEVPIMDGSAAPFYTLIKSVGKKRQNGYRKALRITQEIIFQDGDKVITISPYDGFMVAGKIQFDDSLISTQEFSFELGGELFEKEVAKARTFGYVEQVEELWANGLALGGNLGNVIAIHWNRKSVLNEDGLRYKDEFIRHKVLDLVGDLALLGCPVLGKVSAFKAGHAQHLGLMQAIADAPHCWEIVELKENGEHSVLHSIMNDTKEAAHGLLMPFLAPATLPSAA